MFVLAGNLPLIALAAVAGFMAIRDHHIIMRLLAAGVVIWMFMHGLIVII